MKKTKRILALTGAIILFAMYASTLVFAFMDSSAAPGLLMASIACTILLPIFLYGYTLVYRLSKGDSDSDVTDSDRKDNPS